MRKYYGGRYENELPILMIFNNVCCNILCLHMKIIMSRTLIIGFLHANCNSFQNTFFALDTKNRDRSLTDFRLWVLFGNLFYSPVLTIG